MFFNAKQQALLKSVFQDSMSRIDGDNSLQQSVASSGSPEKVLSRNRIRRHLFAFGGHFVEKDFALREHFG